MDIYRSFFYQAHDIGFFREGGQTYQNSWQANGKQKKKHLPPIVNIRSPDSTLHGDKLDKYLFMLHNYYDDFGHWFSLKILTNMLELLKLIYIIIKYYKSDARLMQTLFAWEMFVGYTCTYKSYYVLEQQLSFFGRSLFWFFPCKPYVLCVF